jgi:hypothetical protein
MTTPDAAQGTADVYVTNAQATSAGTGPGPVTGLPWDEAKQLVDAGYACWGSLPPAGLFGPYRYVAEQ